MIGTYAKFAALSIGIVAFGFFAITLVFYIPYQRQQRYVAEVRPALMRDAMVQSAPVVAALNAYTAAHKKPPSSLTALVPTYLPAVPQAPRLGREWEYHPGPHKIAGQWALLIIVRRKYADPGSFGDVFAYHPSEKYGKYAYGGTRERVGSWAYYHE